MNATDCETLVCDECGRHRPVSEMPAAIQVILHHARVLQFCNMICVRSFFGWAPR